MMNETKEEQKEISVDSWNNFKGSWLKAADIDTFPATAVCIGVTGKEREGKKRVSLLLEYKGKEYNFELNWTNQNIVEEFCPESPKQLVGKKIIFKKTKAKNPSKNFMLVDSLEIAGVEN